MIIKHEKKKKDMGGVSFLADRLGVSQSTIYSAIRNGADLPPCLQIGTRKVWRAEIIDSWREKNEAKPETNIVRAEVGAKGHPRKESVRKSNRGRPTKSEKIKNRMSNTP